MQADFEAGGLEPPNCGLFTRWYLLNTALQIQAGRYYILASLCEAEHLRSCMHISRRNGSTGLVPGSSACLALRSLPSGAMLDASPGFAAGLGHFQTTAAAQLARFLDSATDFNQRDLGVLQRLLGGISADARSRFFVGVRSCRRRPQVETLFT